MVIGSGHKKLEEAVPIRVMVFPLIPQEIAISPVILTGLLLSEIILAFTVTITVKIFL